MQLKQGLSFMRSVIYLSFQDKYMIMELKKGSVGSYMGAYWSYLVLPSWFSVTLFKCNLSDLIHDDELCHDCALLLGGPEVHASCR